MRTARWKSWSAMSHKVARRKESESRNTNHGLYRRSVRRGCARVAPPKTAVRTAAPAVKSRFPVSRLPSIAHYCPAWLPPGHCCPRWPGICPRSLAIARHFPVFLPSRHGFPARDGPLLPATCPRSLAIAQLSYCPGARVQAPSAGNSCCETNPRPRCFPLE